MSARKPLQMRKTKFTPQAQILLKQAYVVKQTYKLLNHADEGLHNLSVCNKNTGKRKRTAQEDGSVAHMQPSAKDIRKNNKLAADVLKVVEKQIERVAANIGGYEQASAFARRNPCTRYPWTERNAKFGLQHFINAPDNESGTAIPRCPPPRRRVLGTLLGPGDSNHEDKEALVDRQLKRNHKKVKKEKNRTNVPNNNAVAKSQRQATKARSTLSAPLKKLQKLHPSEARTLRRLKNELRQQYTAKNRQDRWLTPFEAVPFLARVHHQAPHALICARRYLLEENLVPIKERQLYQGSMLSKCFGHPRKRGEKRGLCT